MTTTPDKVNSITTFSEGIFLVCKTIVCTSAQLLTA